MPVPHPAKEPAFLTIRSGGPFSWFSVTGAIDTPELHSRDAQVGLSTYGSKPLPFIVPAEYTHVEVRRNSGGVARWYLDTLPQTQIGSLAFTGETAGTGPTLLRWSGPRRTFTYTLDGNENHSGLMVSDAQCRYMSADREGTLRGRLTMPAAGYVMVRSDGPWALRSA
ncbi:hypothetical protein [Streptomyces sp. NPDC055243]|uniref:hypothetical protein n=1 Tax=Streptomyces sp. NPDC055243 TaxID=3365720 RepID=UPI0037CD19D4